MAGRKPIFALVLVAFFGILFATPASSEEIVYPKVSSVSPTSLKSGETLTLNGTGFAKEGKLNCTGTYNPATGKFENSFTFTYKTVIGAYKQPKAPTSGVPDFRFEIISISSNMILARVPQGVLSGDYYVGYNAEVAKGICSGFGEILVGFGKYDLVKIAGTSTGTSTPKATPKPTLTPTAKPVPTTTVMPTARAFPTPDIKNTPPPTPAPTTRPNIVDLVGSIFKGLSDFFARLLGR